MPDPKERLWNFHLSKVNATGACTLKAMDWECPINTLYVKGQYLVHLAKVKTLEEISLSHVFKVAVSA